MLRDDIETAVDQNAPCMVLAIHLGPAEGSTGGPADLCTVIQTRLDGATPDDVLSGLVGLKAGYARLVEMMGVSDQNLHNEVRRGLDEIRLQEEGEAQLDMRDQTPDEATDRWFESIGRSFKA